MGLVIADRVKETSATTGTGAYALAGAVTGFQGFVAAIGNGNTCYYCATDDTSWEVGLGTVTDGTPDTLARTSIFASSNGGAAVDWAAGTKSIFVTLAAAKYDADPIAAIFGTPTTGFEFNNSSLSGLTALSPTPDVEAAHTVVPGHYFLRDDAAGVSVCGRYIAATAPFTGITLLTDGVPLAVVSGAGVFIGEATPGVMETCESIFLTTPARTVARERYTNPTTYGSAETTAGVSYVEAPIYLAIRANSTSSIDCLWSQTGRVWKKFLAAHDPSITIGSVGLFLRAQNAAGHAAAFDFFRVWNSALTFPGVA